MTENRTKSPPYVKYLRLHSRINLHTKTTTRTITQEVLQNAQHTSLHYYVSVQTYAQYSFAQENNLSFYSSQTKHKSSHLIFSCPNISLSSKVVGNPLTVSQNIVGVNLLLGTPSTPVPKRRDTT